MREKRYVYKISVEKPEETRLFGRPTCRSEDNIKMCLKYGIRNFGLGFYEIQNDYQVHKKQVISRISKQLAASQCEI